MTTVTVTSYKPGFFEGKFNNLAERFPNFGPMIKESRWNVFLVIAFLFRTTRNFFERTGNKLKAIKFDKPNLLFYGCHLRLSLMFFIKGLIGLVSLGLFNPDITAKASIAWVRRRKDVSDLRAEIVLAEEVEAGIDIENDDEKDKNKNSKVPRYQRERIRRSKLSKEDMDDEIERKLAELNKEEAA